MAAYEVNVEEVEPISRTYQYRKVMKPMLERKRRARINKCLDELKDLMVGALQSEGESITKLEKADVLELTVRHLRKLKQHHALAIPAQNHAHEKFRAGFGHCANEVRRFVEAVPGVDMHISARLVNHLGQWMSQLDKTVPAPPMPQSPISPITSPITVSSPTIAPLNVPRVYTPPASPEAKPNLNLHHQQAPQPLALTVKSQSSSPRMHPYQHNSSTVSSSIHQSHPTTVSSQSRVPMGPHHTPVVVTNPSARIQPPSPIHSPKEPINYSPRPSATGIKVEVPTGIKVEVPHGSPVWRPW